MIISASYKTDIPTFYGEWFINRLRAGYCKMVNPYNRKAFRVDLSTHAVDGFVFWTKNIGPFLQHLPEVRGNGFPFIVQYTINGYPRTLEFSVVDFHKSVEHLHLLRQEYGQKVAVWRYDTIVFTSVTPIEFHRENFSKLAASIEGATDEVVVSFAQIYKKTKRNMNWAAEKFGFTWEDPSDQVKYDFAAELAQIAKKHGMQLSMCSQKAYLASGVANARCVDAARLSEVAGRDIRAKLKGNRPDCGCFISRDIGEYDTCPHGCVYCYAVQKRELAQIRFKEHDPQGEFLFTPKGYEPDEDPHDETTENQGTQLSLF